MTYNFGPNIGFQIIQDFKSSLFWVNKGIANMAPIHFLSWDWNHGKSSQASATPGSGHTLSLHNISLIINTNTWDWLFINKIIMWRWHNRVTSYKDCPARATYLVTNNVCRTFLNVLQTVFVTRVESTLQRISFSLILRVIDNRYVSLDQ